MNDTRQHEVREPFVMMPPDVWPTLRAQLRAAGPLSIEAARLDLRYHLDEATCRRRPTPWPTVELLAELWGWVSAKGKPATKRVRTVVEFGVDLPTWCDPRRAGAWEDVRTSTDRRSGSRRGTERARTGREEGADGARTGREEGAADEGSTDTTVLDGHGEGADGAREGHGEGAAGARQGPHAREGEEEARSQKPEVEKRETRVPRAAPSSGTQGMQGDEPDVAALAWDEARRIHQEAGLGKLPTVAPPRWGFDEAVLTHGPVPVLQIVWWFCHAEAAKWYRDHQGLMRKVFLSDLEDCLVTSDGWCTAVGITVRLPGVTFEPPEHLPWETEHGRRMLDGQVLEPAPYAASWGSVPGGPEAARWHAALHLVGGWPAWCAVDRSDPSAVASFRASWRAAHGELGAAEAAASEWSRGERKRQLDQMVASREWRPHGRYGMHGDPAWRRAWDIAGGSEVLDSMSMTGDGVQAFVLLWSHAWLGVRADASASSSVPTGNQAAVEDLDEVRVRDAVDEDVVDFDDGACPW